MLYKTALIIDDDPLFQIVAEEVLLASGVSQVKLASNGHQGLDVLARSPGTIDLIVCDLQMPSLDGVGVVWELANLKFAGTLVIASSEDRQLIKTVHTMAQMLGIRIAGTLQKPLNAAVLQALLQARPYESKEVERDVLTKSEVMRAIDQRLVCPHYQPQIELFSQRANGFEVLARLKGPPSGMPGAAEYLAAAEHHGLMTDFTMMMLDQVIEDTRRWDQQMGAFKLAVNLSPTSIQDVALPGLLANKFNSAGIDTKSITLEVTEDRLLERKADVLEVLSRLRLAGFRLSVDDFGAGTTSIEQLRLFPFTELKIDRQFVQSAAHDEFSRVSMESSIALAAMLNMSVVAEGVETEEALKFATDSGVQDVQGFYYSRALPATRIVPWVDAFHARKMRTAS